MSADVICHNDFAPRTLAFESGRVVGVIDFDMGSPGPRMWDIAYLATRVVPLNGQLPPGAPEGSEWPRRIQLILDSYGSDASRREVFEVAIIRLRDLAAFSLAKSKELPNPQLEVDARA